MPSSGAVRSPLAIVASKLRHHDAEEGEGWAVRVAGVDEVLAVSRRQTTAVREALGE